MARENIDPRSAQRLLETYNDFSGGINTETSNERLKDNEFPVFENVDLTGRGSARRRYGRVRALTSFPTGTAQGSFEYHRTNQENPDLLLAVSGELYLAYATPVSVVNETPTASGATYTLVNPWVSASGLTVTVSGATQTYVPNPTIAPSVATVANPNGNITVGNYNLGYTFATTSGETILSPTVSIAVQPGEQIQVQAIEDVPTNTTVNYYMTNVNNGTTYHKAASGNGSLIFITALPANTQPQPPATNTATMFSINYATGQLTFATQPSQTPKVSYSYEMKQLSISGLTNGFQSTRPIDAAQYGNVLYIATGTQLCQYDGTNAGVVTPYTPTPMEAIWVGLNGLAPNPTTYLADTATSSSGVTITGIVPQYPQAAAVNKPAQFTAYVNYISGHNIDYQWQWKFSTDTTWSSGLTFAGSGGTNKTWTFTPSSGAGTYDLSVQAKDLTTNALSPVYYLYGYEVDATFPPNPPDTSGIQTCNKCIMHWDRLILCGDTTNPGQMYISDLENPAYFPETNTIDWDMGKREPITGLTRFRDSLFIFTRTTIQALEGQSTDSYKKNLIHTEYGAVAGGTVQVVNNLILFLSEEGLMALEPNIYLTYYNVTRMDYQIRSELLGEIDESATSVFWDNQYWLCIPSKSLIYRYYFDYKSWVRDTGTKLNVGFMVHYGDLLYNFTQDSRLYLVDKSVYTDDHEVYTMKVQSKFLDFDEKFVQKKLKRVYVLAQNYTDHNADIQVTVQADADIVLEPIQGQAYVDSNGNAVWVSTTSPNFHFYAGTALGSWVLGLSQLGNPAISVQDARLISTGSKSRRVRIIFEHTQNNQCEIFGFAFQFRLRRLR